VLASRLNVSTLAVDGCGQKSADSAHESVFRNPSIDEMTSPSGSSSTIVNTKKNELIEVVKSVPRSVSRASIPNSGFR
jgi:hypothetical protein